MIGSVALHDRDEAKTHRKHKIFDHNKSNANAIEPEIKLMTKTGSQESLLATRRLRESLDAALRNSRVHYETHEPEADTRVILSPIKSSGVIKRNSSL